MASDKNSSTESYLKAAGVVKVVNLNDLQIDPTYQREEKPHAEKIAQEFDPAACDPLLVCQRHDGSLWDVDGQQRRKALLSLGITQWMAKVVKSSGPEFEARLFAIKGGARGTVRNLQPREIFKAQLASKDPVAMAIKKIVEEVGLKLGLSHESGYPYLNAYKMLQRNMMACGEDAVRNALKVIKKVWPDQANSTNSAIIDGMIAICYRPETDIDRLERILQEVSVNAVYQESNAYLSGTGTMSRRARAFDAIAKRYNKGLRGKGKRIPVRIKVYDDGQEEVA